MSDEPETISVEEHTAALTERDTMIANLEKAQNIIGSDGKFKKGWASHAGEEYSDLVGTPLESKYSSPAAALMAYRSLEEMNGRGIRVPDAATSPEDTAEFYHKNFDVPKLLEEYQPQEEIADIPEGIERHRETEQFAMEWAFKHHVKPEDIHELIQGYYGQQGGVLEQYQKEADLAQETVAQEIETEIGKSGLKTAERTALALEKKIGADLMSDPVVASNPNVLKLLNHIGTEFITEKNLPVLNRDTTPSSAQAQLDDIYANPNNPYHRGLREPIGSIANTKTFEEQTRLNKILHPET